MTGFAAVLDVVAHLEPALSDYDTFTDSVGAFTGRPFSTPPINHYEGSGVAATVESV